MLENSRRENKIYFIVLKQLNFEFKFIKIILPELHSKSFFNRYKFNFPLYSTFSTSNLQNLPIFEQ